MMVLAHHLSFTLGLTVYGGYVRDLVIGGFVHGAMDIDVRVSSATGHRRVFQELVEWCTANRCSAIGFRKHEKGKGVYNHVIKTPDHKYILLQTVVKRSGHHEPDFNVNALCLMKGGVVAIRPEYADHDLLDIDEIVRSIGYKVAVAMKMKGSDNMRKRVNKMERRGWRVLLKESD